LSTSCRDGSISIEIGLHPNLKFDTESGRMTSSTTFVCIYLCRANSDFLEAFYSSEIGSFLRNVPDVRIFEVYADPDLPQSFHDCTRIVLRTPERYNALSLKTSEMIRYAVRNFRFQRLLKIDVTCIRTDFSEPQYKGRVPLDVHRLKAFLRDTNPNQDYTGFVLHSNASQGDAENWATKKGGKIDYRHVFGEGAMPPFYSGVCYFVSRAFAEYIASESPPMAKEHAEKMWGSEDTMIGRLYTLFRANRSKSASLTSGAF
jgi:hypothetical protein